MLYPDIKMEKRFGSEDVFGFPRVRERHRKKLRR
jgi:hypothetical protein